MWIDLLCCVFSTVSILKITFILIQWIYCILREKNIGKNNNQFL